ncbi:MAG: tetratricopeptide repeat protein [Phycisphaerae bacterium]
MEPDSVGSVLDQANGLLENGKPLEALKLLARLDGESLEDDDRVEVGSLSAWALSEMGRPQDALNLLEKLIDEFPRSSRLLGTRGVVLSNVGDLDQARASLEEAVAADEQDGAAIANLALICERQREFDRALQLYEKAIDAGADIDWVLLRKSAVHSETGDLESARSALHRYLSLAPEDAAQWISLAILYSDQERFDQARECYRAAEAIDADSPSLRLNWGVSATRAGDLAAAHQQLAALQRIAPGSSRACLLEAYVRESEASLEAAEPTYEAALKASHDETPADRVYALEMAMDYFGRRKRVDRCRALLTEAYAWNACTVELCEAFREACGDHIDHGVWFSMMIEADVRESMFSDEQRQALSGRRCTRFVRNVQIIAKDHDDALARALAFVKGMGETGAVVREFVSEEPLDDCYSGIYEVEGDRLYLLEQDEET